jgi:hypothetical protein
MNQRTIPWGTVLAGAIALGTAVLIGLSEVAGVSIPVRSAGPGAVIIVGILILAVGLVVVLRSGRADRAHTGHTADAAHTGGAGGSSPGPVPPAPTERDTAADSATTRTTVTPSAPVQSHPGPLDVTGPGSAEDTTGSATAAGDPAVQTPQSSH